MPKLQKESSAGTFVAASSVYAASRIFCALLGAVKGFLIAKWLGPASYGTWQFVNIFGQYGAYAGLSTRAGITREIPFLRGKGDVEELNTVLSTAFASNLYGPLFYGLVVLGCSCFVLESVNSRALAIYAPVIVLLSWVGYGNSLALAVGQYDVRTRLGLLEDVLTGFLALGLVYVWGVYGVIAGFGLAALAAIVYAARKLRQYLTLEIDGRVFWNLVLIGLPIMANGVLLTTMTAVDQILIAAMLTPEILGVYGLMRSGVVILQVVPSSLGQMLFVKFAELDGKKKTDQDIAQLLDKTTMILSVLLAPILSAAAALLPVAVVLFLPAYKSGVSAGQLLIAALFFLGVSLPATNWCVSTLRNAPVLVLRAIVVGGEFATVYWVIRAGGSLEAIALVVLVAFATFNFAIIMISNYFLEKAFYPGMIRSIQGSLPCLSILAVLWVQSVWYPTGLYLAETRLIVSCGIALIIGLMISSVFAFWQNRRIHFGQLILRSISVTLRPAKRQKVSEA